MKANIAITITLFIGSIAQMNIPIGPDRTLYTYWVYALTVLGRVLFSMKLYGFPISWKIGPALESSTFVLTMIFFLSSKYKNSFPITWLGLLVDMLIGAVILFMMFYEEYNYVYIEKEVDGEDD